MNNVSMMDNEGASTGYLLDILQSFGTQSSAYFSFQQNIRYFCVDDGFIAYAPQWTPFGKVNLIFNNPVCDPDALGTLIPAFLRAHPLPCVFIGVDASVQAVLQQQGFKLNHIGIENRIKLAGFDLHGKSKKQLRHAANFGQREDCVVRELPWHEVPAEDVYRISNQWRKGKRVSKRELRLLTRPPVFADEWGVRKFYAMQAGRIQGFVYFDPYFEQGQVKGYCANIIRMAPEAKSGMADYIILQAMQQFQKEGIGEVSLGISPLANIQSMSGEHVGLRVLARLLFEHGNFLYAFKGLAYHKSRYRPAETPLFMGIGQGASMVQVLWALLFGTGICQF